MLGIHIGIISHRVTPSGQFGVPYKLYLLVEDISLQEINMSKQRKIVKRKRKTGYINLVKPSPFKFTFATFEQFAMWAKQ